MELFSLVMLYRDIDIREHILDSKTADDQAPLLRILSEKLKLAKDPAVIGQIVDIFRRLVDTDNIDSLWRRKEEFLSLVYKYWFPNHLLEPILNTELSSKQCTLKSHLFDLFSFCAARHGSRVRSFITSNNILEIIIRNNLENGPGFLKLAVIRLFRQAIADKDKKIEIYITTKNLFDPIMKLFRENSDRYNMVNSAIIELFDFIKIEYEKNFRLLIYLVERFRKDFEDVTYVNTFSQLVDRYDNHQEVASQQETKSNDTV